jgi:hypothetical protein
MPRLNGRAILFAESQSRRLRLFGLLALLLVAAQLLFAAHVASAPDDLIDHAPSSCEFCLAAAVSGDPDALVDDIAAQLVSFSSVRQPVAADIIVVVALRAANSRGPPLR